MVHSPDPFKEALKRPITIIPSSITTTHHDGSLPSPFLRPCQQQLSPPLYAYSTFKAKFEVAPSLSK